MSQPALDIANDMSKSRGGPFVLLYAVEGIGLVLLRPTGVRYVNQVGGHACLQLSADGAYLPLGGYGGARPELLSGMEANFEQKYQGWDGFDAASAGENLRGRGP